MAQRNRPLFLWFIVVFYLAIGAYMALLAYGLMYTRDSLDKDMLAYWDTYSRFDFLSVATIEMVNIAASVCLFLLRKDGFYLFVFALSLNLLLAFWDTLARGWAVHNQNSIFTGGLLGILFQVGFAAYSWKLLRDERLT
jgi:hypothetical protein